MRQWASTCDSKLPCLPGCFYMLFLTPATDPCPACSSCVVPMRAVRDAASRTAWFATINSTSALFILGLQLLATGGWVGRWAGQQATGQAGRRQESVAWEPGPTATQAVSWGRVCTSPDLLPDLRNCHRLAAIV